MKKTLLLPLLVLIIALIAGFLFSKNDKKPHPKLKPFEDLHFMRNYPDFEKGHAVYLQQMQKETMRLQKASLNKTGGQPQWITQGPYNIGGRINTIAHNPNNGNIIYVGSVCGGIHKTTNGGTTWNPIFDEQPYLAISHIAISPMDANTLYVGTGDPNISGYPWVGNGIYRSADAGITWEHLGLENTGIVTKIALHPSNPKIIYAATMGIPFIRDNNRGLYKSTDGGLTWNQILFLTDEAGIIDMVMVPNSPDTLIVAGWNRIRNYNESISSGAESKLYRTFDGGANWEPLSTGLPTENISRIGLTLSIQDSLQIVAQFVNSTLYETEGIFRSSDFGSSWVKLTATNLEGDVLGGFGWYFGKIRVNPYNKNQLFVLGVDLYRSDNGGQFFEMTTPPWFTYEVHADKHDLVFIDSSTILLSTDGGLYKSVDNGWIWTDVENIPNTQFYRVAVDPVNNGFYSGGAQDNGTLYGTISDSANWLHVLGGDGFQPLFDPKNPDLLYAETQNGGLYYGIKQEGEYNWNYFDYGIDEGDRRSWDMPICMSKKNPQILYTGTYRVYRITDAPDGTWSAISDDLTDGTNHSYHIISAIAVSPLTDSLVASGSSDGRVHIYDSIEWQNVTPGLPERYVTCIKFSPNTKNSLFVTHSGYKANENIPHVHYSQNLGADWKDISGNLPQLAINSLVVLKGYGDSVIFAATDGGIYHTLNQGETWQRTGSGMPMIPVYDLAYDDTNHVLVAGTFARSMMTLTLAPIVEKQIEVIQRINEEKYSVRVFPNPAHQFLTIESEELPVNTQVQLADISGRLMLEETISKNSQIHLDVSKFVPGTYVITLKNLGKTIYTQKLIVNSKDN
ncbi:MAG TPA: hypothetical protein DD653_12160 [Marinilabiliales bacterium]|nr:MAG: hypothetical protein A2W84_18945 [Bacteroidetes bacterium GWC2_40_13]HBO75422.1 hypothetical protein [Marinilabiliales bacterium]